jgi:hypothetical protein
MLRIAVIMLLGAACNAKSHQSKNAPTKSAASRDCSKLWDSAPPGATNNPFNRDWFISRCELAGLSAATPCMTSCDDMRQTKELCWAAKGSGCVQEAATKAAVRSDLAAQVVAHAKGQALTAQGSRIVLPEPIRAAALNGEAWAAKRDEGTLVYLTTWRGRQTNTAGLLYRDSPWNEIGKDLMIVGLPFETAMGGPAATTDEPEPFTVVERVDDNWLLVHYGWD